MERTVQYMTIRETLKRDLQTIFEFLVDATFWIICAVCKVVWFIFTAAISILLLLFVRDCVQWFLGTNRKD